MISACEFPPKELFPRMVILEAEPKDPDCEICNPATLPTSELARLLSLIVLTFSPDTSVTAYPRDFFFLEIPKAVITTSSKASVSCSKIISSKASPFRVTSLVL